MQLARWVTVSSQPFQWQEDEPCHRWRKDGTWYVVTFTQRANEINDNVFMSQGTW